MFSLTTRNSGSKTSSNHNRVYFGLGALFTSPTTSASHAEKKKNILVNRYQVKLTAIVTSQLYTLIRKDNGFSWVCRPTVAACVFKQRGRGAGAFGGGQLLQRLISRTTSCLFRGCFFTMSLLQTNHNNNKNTSGTWGTTSTEFPVGGESAALSVLAVGQPEGHRLCFLVLSRV